MWELRIKVLAAMLCGASILIFSRGNEPLLFPVQPVVCMGSDSVVHSKQIPNNNSNLKPFSSAINEGLRFEIIYTDVPEVAKPAIEYAFAQWSSYFNSALPIRIKVTWKALGRGVLGSSGPTSAVPGSDYDNMLPNVLYPVALAEKLTRKELSANNGNDAEMTLNSEEGMYYYGTDGKTPSDKYDLVTIVMHEFVHCIGFVGSMKVPEGSNQGTWGDRDPPLASIFDQFVMNNNGIQLINTDVINNPSVALKQNYTSNNLYFRSPVAYVKNSMFEWPRLYAPSNFNYSSIYHLNDFTYPYNDINALMTHQTGLAEANHNPGPLVLGMLEEMGWSHTYIQHNKHKDIEDVSEPLEFEATIESDNPLLEPLNYIFYRLDENSDFDSLLMDEEDLVNEFSCSLPIEDTFANFEYFIKAYDNFGRAFYFPDTSESGLLRFYIGPDTIKPQVIHHSPIAYMAIDEPSKEIYVNVWDNIGIDTVIVKYTVNEVDLDLETGLFYNRDDLYSGELKFDEVQLRIDDIIEYSILVVDNSEAKNTLEYKTDDMIFEIEDKIPIKDEYTQEFNEYTNDFIGVRKTVREGDLFFEVSTPEGLIDGCLHTPNPYVSIESKKSEYIAQLRFPIRLDETGGIVFDEIVLVEPGSSGAVFGDSTFFDYVIVEASNDSGLTWKPILPGYDSRSYNKWINTYKSVFDVAKNNSLAKPTSSTYITRNFSMLKGGGFAPNDEIFIRFRLHSDENSHGWGWAIDNLKIQGEVGVDDLPFSNAAISVYPNPFHNRLSIGVDFKVQVDELKVIVKDILGKNWFYDSKRYVQHYFEEFNASDFPSGIYLVVFDTGIESKTMKVIKP